MAVFRKIALSAVLIPLGVVLSIYPGAIPIGPTKVFPFQHMINGISGVLLGPWYAVFIAFSIGVLRISSGFGTFFAFPGGIPGALMVGLAYRYLWKSDRTALLEPLGTAVGAFISALIVAPMMGLPMSPSPFMAQLGLTAQWEMFLLAFLMSSVPGAVMGYVVVVALRRRKVIERL